MYNNFFIDLYDVVTISMVLVLKIGDCYIKTLLDLTLPGIDILTSVLAEDVFHASLGSALTGQLWPTSPVEFRFLACERILLSVFDQRSPQIKTKGAGRETQAPNLHSQEVTWNILEHRGWWHDSRMLIFTAVIVLFFSELFGYFLNVSPRFSIILFFIVVIWWFGDLVL